MPSRGHRDTFSISSSRSFLNIWILHETSPPSFWDHFAWLFCILNNNMIIFLCTLSTIFTFNLIFNKTENFEYFLPHFYILSLNFTTDFHEKKTILSLYDPHELFDNRFFAYSIQEQFIKYKNYKKSLKIFQSSWILR